MNTEKPAVFSWDKKLFNAPPTSAVGDGMMEDQISFCINQDLLKTFLEGDLHEFDPEVPRVQDSLQPDFGRSFHEQPLSNRRQKTKKTISACSSQNSVTHANKAKKSPRRDPPPLKEDTNVTSRSLGRDFKPSEWDVLW